MCATWQDYSVPEISLFPEENAEGKKVVFRDTSEDARIFGFPIKANSIIINAGLWVSALRTGLPNQEDINICINVYQYLSFPYSFKFRFSI